MSNKKSILVIIGGLIVVIATYTIISINAWEGFAKNNVTRYNSLQQQSKKVLDMPSDTQSNKNKKQIAIEDLNTTIAKNDRNCMLNLLFQWQQFLSINNQRINYCRQQNDRVNKFNNDLKSITTYLKDEKAYADIITQAAKTQDTVADTDWTVIDQQWQSAVKTFQQKPTAKPFAATKTIAINKAQNVEKAWQALIVANQAKDKARYDQAAASLDQAYQALDEISQSTQNNLTPLIDNLEKSYEQAFKT